MVHRHTAAALKRAAAIASVCALIPCLACCVFYFGEINGDGSIDPERSRLGINLSGLCDWNTELPFVDVFRLSRAWVSQREGSEWGQGPALDLDEHGWVRSLAAGCYADALMCSIEGRHYPMGRYVCLYDGTGTIEMLNVERTVSSRPGRVVFEPLPGAGGFCLRIASTDPGDYIRNIRVVMPGFESSYRDDPFNPGFIQRWKSFRAFRFMDWMSTNGSTVTDWESRPKMDDSTWTVKGVPVEVMIDLSNRTGIDPWFCIPHLATDDYVRNFAETVRDGLDAGRKAYVEYSNEVWNTSFVQTDYALARGVALGLGPDDDFLACLRYGSRRSVEIFRIWEEAFGGVDRLVRVMASQAANAWVSEQKLSFEGASAHCDALAIAPYIALCPSPDSEPSIEEVAGWSTEGVLDYLEGTALPESIRWMRESKAVAVRYGVELISYEAGQHAVGVLGGENVDAATALFLEANRTERMGRIYGDYLDAWLEAGGGLCSVFSSVSGWSKWGSWGLIEFQDDDTPKYRAVVEWNLRHPLAP